MSTDRDNAEFAALHLQGAQRALDMADGSESDRAECASWRLLAESAINRAHFILTGKQIAEVFTEEEAQANAGGVQ